MNIRFIRHNEYVTLAKLFVENSSRYASASKKDILPIAKEFVLLNEKKFYKTLVCEKDGNIIGVLHMKIKNIGLFYLYLFWFFFRNFSLVGFLKRFVVRIFQESTIVRGALYIDQLFVLDAYRGHGVATKMLRHVFGLLENDKKKKKISLYVNSYNSSALYIYKKLGFIVSHPLKSILVNIFTPVRYFYMSANTQQYNERIKYIEEDFPKVRVCMLMNRFHIGANILLNKVIQDPNIEIVGIVWKSIWGTSRKKSQQGIFVSWKRWGGKVGHYFLLGLIGIVILHFVQVVIIEALLMMAVFRGRNYLRTMNGIVLQNGIPLIRTVNVNDDKTIEYIKALKPDILLSNNFSQILKKEVIEIPLIATINGHPGKLPFYRGLLPHFWAMVNGEDKVSMTLHYIDEGVDTGQVIEDKEFSIEKHDSFYSVWKKASYHYYELLGVYFSKIRSGKKVPVKLSSTNKKGKYFSFPGYLEYLKFLKKGKVLLKLKDVIHNFKLNELSKKSKKGFE